MTPSAARTCGARMSLLSEIPAEWAAAVRGWSAINERHRRGGFPDRNTEYLFYQTVFGTWPIELPRMLAYMDKAVCEAKVHTSWTRRDERYHEALAGFVTGVMQDAEFTAALERFVTPLVVPGYVVSLAQTLLKLTAPGIPDVYQGTELWDWSLVDPDNRRSVDFEARAHLLAELDSLSMEQLWQRRAEGLPKLKLIQKALQFRRDVAGLFDARGSYEPLPAQGCKAAHVVAFARVQDNQAALVVVPRLLIRLGDGKGGSPCGEEVWQDTRLVLPDAWRDSTWHNILTGERVSTCPGSGSTALPLGELLARFPVALLEHVSQ